MADAWSEHLRDRKAVDDGFEEKVVWTGSIGGEIIAMGEFPVVNAHCWACYTAEPGMAHTCR